MAHTGDPDLVLDQDGNLVELHKKSDQSKWLQPDQVAKCVKFIRLKPFTNEDGAPDLIFEPFKGETKGMKVNVVGGATGTGKTSLIRLLAGGMAEEARTGSHTKCPTVYIMKLDGKDYAVLDTAGLCDTAADAFNDMDLKELLINAVAATMKRYELEMVTFNMLVSKLERLPGKFGENWPTFQNSLGGDKIHTLTQFVVSKANMEAKSDRIQLAKELKNPDPKSFFNELKYSPLKWPVVTSGYGNLKELTASLLPMGTDRSGISGEAMDSNVESLERKRKLADDMDKAVEGLKKKLKTSELDPARFHEAIDALQGQINSAKEELASLGGCSDDQRRKIRAQINQYESKLLAMKKNRGNTEESRKKAEEEAFQLAEELRQKMEDIRKDEGLGQFFNELVGVGKKVLAKVL